MKLSMPGVLYDWASDTNGGGAGGGVRRVFERECQIGGGECAFAAQQLLDRSADLGRAKLRAAQMERILIGQHREFGGAVAVGRQQGLFLFWRGSVDVEHPEPAAERFGRFLRGEDARGPEGAVLARFQPVRQGASEKLVVFERIADAVAADGPGGLAGAVAHGDDIETSARREQKRLGDIDAADHVVAGECEWRTDAAAFHPGLAAGDGAVLAHRVVQGEASGGGVGAVFLHGQRESAADELGGGAEMQEARPRQHLHRRRDGVQRRIELFERRLLPAAARGARVLHVVLEGDLCAHGAADLTIEVDTECQDALTMPDERSQQRRRGGGVETHHADIQRRPPVAIDRPTRRLPGYARLLQIESKRAIVAHAVNSVAGGLLR